MIFQVVFTIILGDTKASPFTVGITQLIHDTCRSKQLITVFNRLGFCNSYESIASLTQRIIRETGRHRVRASSQITTSNIIHGAMDNYVDAANHDTILMLFQNQQNCDKSASISKMENQCRS